MFWCIQHVCKPKYGFFAWYTIEHPWYMHQHWSKCKDIWSIWIWIVIICFSQRFERCTYRAINPLVHLVQCQLLEKILNFKLCLYVLLVANVYDAFLSTTGVCGNLLIDILSLIVECLGVMLFYVNIKGLAWCEPVAAWTLSPHRRKYDEELMVT